MNNSCRRCGKETGEGEVYCSQCQDSIGTVKPRKIWFFAVFFSALILVLAGMLIWHGHAGTWDLSWDRLMGRPAAMINGEAMAGAPARGGGCCSTGGSGSSVGPSSGCGGKGSAGGCGTKGSDGPINAKTEKKAREAALAAYKKKDGNTERIKITVSDYGCHIQVDVDKDGKIVKSYSYLDGNVIDN